MKISVVANTYNEEKNLERCLESVKNFGDEIIVVDMHSTDRTVDIAEKFKAKIFFHNYTRFVEPARNFALSKATGDWVFLIDADEELPLELAEELKKVAFGSDVDWVEIPRKNLIFGKWITHCRWWPDYLIRFFRKNKVKFSDKIHVPPSTTGKGLRIEPEKDKALIHYNFQTVAQFVERLNRYTDIQSEELTNGNYKFKKEDVLIKPANEFFSRFFAGEGYKDGFHGLALALLQMFSELVLYLKIWEKEGFKDQSLQGMEKAGNKVVGDLFYWQGKSTANIWKKLCFKFKTRI